MVAKGQPNSSKWNFFYSSQTIFISMLFKALMGCVCVCVCVKERERE
jgi:hypothetical protein